MMYGITFRGRHSQEFGVAVKTKLRPASPPVRTQEETASFCDGAVDYSNQNGRLYYDDKFMELEFTVPRPELRLTQKAVSKIVSWLSGWYGEMIFDDMPYIIWDARPIDLSEVAIELYRVGKVTVQFRCKPFNRLKYSSLGIPLDSDFLLDSNIALGYGEDSVSSIEIAVDGDHDTDAVGEITYHYIGDAPVRPQLKIEGAFKKIDLNGCCLEYQGEKEHETLLIDCETWKTYAGDSNEDITALMDGDYPELLPGDNVITLTGEERLSVTVSIVCYPRYLYGDVGFYEEETENDSCL